MARRPCGTAVRCSARIGFLLRLIPFLDSGVTATTPYRRSVAARRGASGITTRGCRLSGCVDRPPAAACGTECQARLGAWRTSQLVCPTAHGQRDIKVGLRIAAQRPRTRHAPHRDSVPFERGAPRSARFRDAGRDARRIAGNFRRNVPSLRQLAHEVSACRREHEPLRGALLHERLRRRADSCCPCDVRCRLDRGGSRNAAVAS